MDSSEDEQGRERATRRVGRTRSPDSLLPAPRGTSVTPLPMVEVAPPRLNLSFILNDTVPTWDSATPMSSTATSPDRLAYRGRAQRGSPPLSLDRSALTPVGGEQPGLPLAPPIWRAEAKSADAAWGIASPEGKREALGSEAGEDDDDEEKMAVKEEERERDEGEEKADALPTAHARVAVGTMSREEKRRGRTCRMDGCDNYIVHKGLCCRHGGARKCTTEGCTSTAKYMGLCWKHGGSTWCKVEGCSKRAKAKGRCWAHGGGTQCGHDGCAKVAVSNGLCWAHGGGKRCLFDGCNRPGYERTNGFCDRHHDEVKDVNYFEV